MNKKHLLIILLALAGGVNIMFAQTRSLGKYSITTQPLQFLCRDVPITVERIFKRNTLGITFGYRFDSDLENNPTNNVEYWGGRHEAFTCPLYNGATIGVSSKYYFTKKSRMYFEGQLFYRFWWYNNRSWELPYKGSSFGFDYNSSLRNHVFGFKFLWGQSYIPKKIRKVNPVFSWYVGIGIRKKYLYEYGERCRTSYSGNSPYYPFEEKSAKWEPSTQAGFSLGVEVFSKNKLMKKAD